jgi:hypothetical protein
MELFEWIALFTAVVAALSVALAMLQRLHGSAANVSWWPL